ncbi:hypothetical protein HK096_002899 [Nowakowskiella sp. JEL0078]|nr:hypothetical protein HK096_002899 [Nowakowskiella sp. JEL0078]
MLGVREYVEQKIAPYVREYAPEQHTTFYNKLTYILLGTLDSCGRPWASLIIRDPKDESPIIQSENEEFHTKMKLSFQPLVGDPIVENLKDLIDYKANIAEDSIRDEAHFGLLGIEFHTRRRNRANGVIDNVILLGNKITADLNIQLTTGFRNCPKYIQGRIPVSYSPILNDSVSITKLELNSSTNNNSNASSLTSQMQEIISKSDTFFIATRYIHHDPNFSRSSSGVDVSHRGGRSGFVHLLHDDLTTTVRKPLDSTMSTSVRALVWPDYKGNNMYMTLGNIHSDPRVGLVFPDFDSGAMLYVTGRAEILFDDAAQEIMHGSQRCVRVVVDEAILSVAAMPFVWKFIDSSPFNPPLKANKNLRGQKVRFADVRLDSKDTVTLKLEFEMPVKYIPGQYVTLDFSGDRLLSQLRDAFANSYPGALNDDLIRSWTISSAPTTASLTENSFEVTIKAKPKGLVTTVLHQIAHLQIFGKEVEFTPNLVVGLQRISLEGISLNDLDVRLLGIDGDFTPINTEGFISKDVRPKLLFVAGGIGITPFLSTIRWLNAFPDKFIADANISVLWAVKTPEDSYSKTILKEFAEIQKSYESRIKFVVFLTRDSNLTPQTLVETGIEVERGRITQQKVREWCEDVSERESYVCGPEGFMNAMQKMFSDDFKVPGGSIHSENFQF